jgi:hypothetical protein
LKEKKVIYVTFIPEGFKLEFEDSLYIGISATREGVEHLNERNYSEERF